MCIITPTKNQKAFLNDIQSLTNEDKDFFDNQFVIFRLVLDANLFIVFDLY